MIDLNKYEIVIKGERHPIVKVDVWWVVANKGLFDDLVNALEYHEPIYPTPVAVAANGVYEVLPAELK